MLASAALLACLACASGNKAPPQQPYGYVSSGYQQNAGGGYYETAAGGGYDEAAGGAYEESSGGTYYQNAGGGYDQTATGGYDQTATGGYDQTATGGYDQTAMGGYVPTSTGGYEQTATGGYVPTSTGGYVQTSPSSYVQTSTSGSFTVSSTTSGGGEGPAELPFGYRDVRMGASCSECDQSAALAAGLACAVPAHSTCGDSAGLCYRGPLDGSGLCTHGCNGDAECQSGWRCVDSGVGTSLCRQ
jgi:hypothetical protein